MRNPMTKNCLGVSTTPGPHAQLRTPINVFREFEFENTLTIKVF